MCQHIAMGVREDINSLLKKHGYTIKEMTQELQERLDYEFPASALYNKLKKKTLRYEEARLIGEILGYELEFVKKRN